MRRLGITLSFFLGSFVLLPAACDPERPAEEVTPDDKDDSGVDPPDPGEPPDNSCPDGQKSCSGKCVDFKVDPLNCGACGHDCLGATCPDRVCTPNVLASGEDVRNPIAMDDTQVIFVKAVADSDTEETIFRVPKTGGAAVEVTKTGKVHSLVLAKGRVIWSTTTTVDDVTEHKVESCVLPGCTDRKIMVPADQGGAQQILAADGDKLYWVNGVDSTEAKRYAVESCTIASCSGSIASFAPADPAPPGENPPTPGIAIAPSAVFWSALGKLHSCAKTGTCAGTPLALPGSIGKVATDGKEFAFWSFEAGKGSKIFTCPVAGCGATPFQITAISYGEIQTNDIALDDKQVYFSLGDELEVCPRPAGCGEGDTAPVVTSSHDANVTILTDATHVYVVHYGGVAKGYELVRAPK